MKLILYSILLASLSAIATSKDTRYINDAQVIYSDGLSPEWSLISYGSKVDSDSLEAIRLGTQTSLYAKVSPFATVKLAASTPFSTSSVLEAWIQGSLIDSAELVLEDSASRRYSKSVPLAIANAEENAKISRLEGPDTNGWWRLQVNLAALVAGSSLSVNGSITKGWDRIVFKDISGEGFVMAISEAVLLPADISSIEGAPAPETISCIGSACTYAVNGVIPSFELELVPLFGFEIGVLSIGPVELIAKLAPETTVGEAMALCLELSGATAMEGAETVSTRFTGSCDLGTEGAAAMVAADQDAPLDWPFLGISVDTPMDLMAMRVTLQSTVEYFERDGIAHALPFTPRRMLGQLDGDVLNTPAPEGNSSDVDTAASCSISLPWGLDRVDQTALPLNRGFTPGRTGKGVHIYVLDTGIRETHNEVRGRVLNGANCASAPCSTTRDTRDRNGHGTHVAGTAAGSCVGVAKEASLHAVKVLGDNGSGSYSGIINGIQWAVNDIIKNGWRGVINMSLGGGASQALNDALKVATERYGVPVVVAAGNEYSADACTKSPSSAASAITVASTTREDAKSSFSNVGSCVDVWAPGSSIVSSWLTRDNAYASLSGTSMASPHVAGAAALVLEARPTATAEEVAAFLAAGSVQRNWFPGTTQNFLQTQKDRLVA